MRKWFKNIGPATLVAAAFIGPGTVTLCSMAGVEFGFDLLWAAFVYYSHHSFTRNGCQIRNYYTKRLV